MPLLKLDISPVVADRLRKMCLRSEVKDDATIIRHALAVLAFFQDQFDAGFSEITIRNPETGQILPVDLERAK